MDSPPNQFKLSTYIPSWYVSNDFKLDFCGIFAWTLLRCHLETFWKFFEVLRPNPHGGHARSKKKAKKILSQGQFGIDFHCWVIGFFEDVDVEFVLVILYTVISCCFIYYWRGRKKWAWEGQAQLGLLLDLLFCRKKMGLIRWGVWLVRWWNK